MNENNVEVAAEFKRLEDVAQNWDLVTRRDTVIDTFTIKWGMPKDEVAELVDSYLRLKERNLPQQASWVIKEKGTGLVVLETFDQKKVNALNTKRYEAIPILQYLQGLNQSNHERPRG